MNRRFARNGLVSLGLLTLAACVVNLSFAMDKPGILLKTDPGHQSLTQQAVQVDLGDYKEIKDHQANIKSLDLDSAVITITAVDPLNTASTVSGTVALRKALADPAANDVPVGSIPSTPIQTNQQVTIKGTPALDAFLLQQLQSAGSFYVIINGAVDHGVANVTVDIKINASLGYDTGIL